MSTHLERTVRISRRTWYGVHLRDLAITPEVREDHATYIASWLKVLKDDKRAVFAAASHAQKAADYLTALQPGAAVQAA